MFMLLIYIHAQAKWIKKIYESLNQNNIVDENNQQLGQIIILIKSDIKMTDRTRYEFMNKTGF